MLFDTHVHIFDKAFESDYDEVLNRCKDMKIMVVGFDLETNKKAHDYAVVNNSFCAFGVHPTSVDEISSDYFDELTRLIQLPCCKAIGECGLDYHWQTDREKQKDYFIRQILLSIEYNLPLVIHVRDALNDAYQILKEFKGKISGVMHSFSGSYEMAQMFIDLGLYIGIGGPVTFKNAKTPKDVASRIDIDRLVIETDCPYLTPTPHRGKRNEPSYVKYVLDEIALLRNIDPKELEHITYHNGLKLFNLEDNK